MEKKAGRNRLTSMILENNLKEFLLIIVVKWCFVSFIHTFVHIIKMDLHSSFEKVDQSQCCLILCLALVYNMLFISLGSLPLS